MLRPADQFFLQKNEPVKSCLQFLRGYILRLDTAITETWKYGMPVYCYNGKMFCYLWVHKKYHQPYIGFVEGKSISHPDLLQEKRARMKILLIDPESDIPMVKLAEIFSVLLNLYQQK